MVTEWVASGAQQQTTLEADSGDLDFVLVEKAVLSTETAGPVMSPASPKRHSYLQPRGLR